MIWVVGAGGMLGHDMVRGLDARGLAHVDTDAECDITDAGAVERFSAGNSIDWIVNCAAYTAVDKAEDEAERAEAINGRGPANLARIAAAHRARMIHISTDYVFDGEKTSPYTEDDPIRPQSTYGRTKALGESLLMEETAAYFIVRTAWLYGVHGKNFVSTMLRLMNEREEVMVVADQRGTPTFSRDLAEALCAVVESNSHAYGIYHYTNDGETTWHEFASLTYVWGRRSGLLHRDCVVRPITTDMYPTKATRPKYSVLSKDKIRRVFNLTIPSWQDALDRFLSEIAEGAAWA